MDVVKLFSIMGQGSDRFTDPQGTNSAPLLPASAGDLSGLIPAFTSAFKLQKIYFHGDIGTIVGYFTDDGTTTPTATAGKPIYGGDVWGVTEKSLAKTKVIAQGTPVRFGVSQYLDENPYN